MPTPCPPFAQIQCYGPFRVAFTVELPLGYTDRVISWDDGGMVRTSELHHTLTAAWNEFPAEMTVSIGGREPETIWFGTDPLVAKAPLLSQDRNPPPSSDDTWFVQVWVHAPYAPTSAWLDYPYLARLWASGLHEVALPGKTLPARLSTTDVAYLVNNRFAGLLPRDYAPSDAAGVPTEN